MTKDEQMKLSIRTAYNQLEIAIKEGREAGLNPRLLVRAYFYGEPIFSEPRFAKEALVEAVLGWEYQVFITQPSPTGDRFGWFPFKEANIISPEQLQELLNEGIVRKVLKKSASESIIEDAGREIADEQVTDNESFYYQQYREKV